MASLPDTSLVALSGRVAAGKTTLATGLSSERDAAIVKTREILEALAEDSYGRTRLQEIGRQLDRRTAGRWVADAVATLQYPLPHLIVIDAVRIPEQVEALRELAPTVHIHLTAPLAVLAERHALAHPNDPDYEIVSADPVEAMVEALARTADLVIETAENDVPQTRAAAADFTARS